MQMPDTKEQVSAKVKKILIDKGVDADDAGYLGELYASSPKGQSHQAPKDPKILGSNCNVGGILPIG
jgi:hypothetical protein